MKKVLILSLTIALMQFTVSAQSIGIFGGGGYTFGDNFDTEYGYGRVNESGHWNVGMLFNLKQNYGIKLTFQQQPTTGKITDFVYGTGSGDVNVTYILASGQKYLTFSDVAKGYAGLELGMAIFGNPDLQSTVEKFAWGIGLGVEIIQALLLEFVLVARC